jgi:peptidoglycan-N-acetylglucosamine deacetylase
MRTALAGDYPDHPPKRARRFAGKPSFALPLSRLLHVASMRAATAAGCLASAALWWGPGAAAHCRIVARVLDLPCRLERLTSGVALTFDDGPHPAGTRGVLDALAAGGARATFFLVGEQVLRYPDVVREIVAAGHEPAVHGFRHRNQMRLSAAAVAADLTEAFRVISQVSGVRPRIYRPPYGAFTAGGLAVVRRSPLQPLLWSRWGRDWRSDICPRRIVSLAADRLKAGDVILLHDADWYSARGSHTRTVRALPAILDEIRARGLQALAVSSGFP